VRVRSRVRVRVGVRARARVRVGLGLELGLELGLGFWVRVRVRLCAFLCRIPMHMSFSILILMQILICFRVLFGVYFTSSVHYVKAFLGYHCCTKRLIVSALLIALGVMDQSRRVDLMGDLGPDKTQSSTFSDLVHF
ncbi:hypothetical protein M8756_18875, partial [Lutimaribacter sp. EGI FJ00015]|nr:hypothetical protein [Lutimaribacter sp. EGI FJ00015]